MVKLIEKKGQRQLLPKECPTSLLNVDHKIKSKALATILKETFPDLITCQQTAYVKNRFIVEGGRLIFNILEISNVLNLRGYMVTVDIEKVFFKSFFFTSLPQKIWIWS